MKNEQIEALLEHYYESEEYAILVDKYIDEYMGDDPTYTKDDIRGIVETMDAESIAYLISKIGV